MFFQFDPVRAGIEGTCPKFPPISGEFSLFPLHYQLFFTCIFLFLVVGISDYYFMIFVLIYLSLTSFSFSLFFFVSLFLLLGTSTHRGKR